MRGKRATWWIELGGLDQGAGKRVVNFKDHQNHDIQMGTNMTSMMHSERPWRKKQRTDAASSTRVLAPRVSAPAVDTAREDVEEEDASVGGGETHDDGYHRLIEEMGVADRGEELPRCSGFSATKLEAVRDCLAAGGWPENYIARVEGGTVPSNILGHMLEDVGYTCEARQLGEEHAATHTQEEEKNTSLMQRTVSASRPPTNEPVERETDMTAPSNARSEPPSRGLRGEDLSVADRAIMDACENDETWQTIRLMRGSTKENCLTALCTQSKRLWKIPGRYPAFTTGHGDGGRRFRRLSVARADVRHDPASCHGDHSSAICLGAVGGH